MAQDVYSKFGDSISVSSKPHDKIRSDLNVDFGKLSDNNPFLVNEYSSDIWDKIGNFFGFNTREDMYRLEQGNRARLYDSQLLETQREEAYNSEAARASRMRAAGLNPDLQGLSVASSASEFDNQSLGTQEVPQGVSFHDVGSTIISVLGMALDIYPKVLSISSAAEGVTSQRVQNALQMSDFLKEFTSGRFPTVDNLDSYDSREFKKIVRKNFHLSRRSAQTLDHLYTQLVDSPGFKSRRYKDTNEETEAMTQYFENEANPMKITRMSMDEQIQGTMLAFSDFFSLQWKNNFQKAKNEYEGLKNEYEYAKSFNGALSAEAQNEANETNRQSQKMSRQVQSASAKVVNKLSKQANEGNVFASIALMLFQFFSSSNASSAIGAVKSLAPMIH